MISQLWFYNFLDSFDVFLYKPYLRFLVETEAFKNNSDGYRAAFPWVPPPWVLNGLLFFSYLSKCRTTDHIHMRHRCATHWKHRENSNSQDLRRRLTRLGSKRGRKLPRDVSGVVTFFKHRNQGRFGNGGPID